VFGSGRFVPIPLPQVTHKDMLPVLVRYWKTFLLSNEVTVDSQECLLQMLRVSAVLRVNNICRAQLLPSALHLKGIKTCDTTTESAAEFRITQLKVTTAFSSTGFSNFRSIEKTVILDDLVI
jgi:hypothetical protein